MDSILYDSHIQLYRTLLKEAGASVSVRYDAIHNLMRLAKTTNNLYNYGQMAQRITIALGFRNYNMMKIVIDAQRHDRLFNLLKSSHGLTLLKMLEEQNKAKMAR